MGSRRKHKPKKRLKTKYKPKSGEVDLLLRTIRASSMALEKHPNGLGVLLSCVILEMYMKGKLKLTDGDNNER